MTTWSMKSIETERTYEITDAPDLQDSESKHRMVIRPRKVTLHQVYGTHLVRGAVIEGRQVRRDGGLAGSKMILAGVSTDRWGYNATPPPWLNKILADAGLEWTTRNAVPPPPDGPPAAAHPNSRAILERLVKSQGPLSWNDMQEMLRRGGDWGPALDVSQQAVAKLLKQPGGNDPVEWLAERAPGEPYDHRERGIL